MSVTTRIVKNSSFLIMASLIASLIAFVINLFTARYLGTYGFGLISSATSLVGIFGIFCDLGLSTYAIREVSRDKSKTNIFFGTTGLLRLIFTFITFIIYSLFVMNSHFVTAEFYVMILFGIYMVFNSFSTFFYSLFQSNEEMQYQTIGTTIYNVSLLIIILAVIYLKGNVIFVTAGYPIAIAIAAIYTIYIALKHYPKFTISKNKGFYSDILINGIPFGITGVFTSIYFWIPSVMLTFLSGSVAVGLFSSSQKLLLVLGSILGLISNAVFPVMSELYKKDQNKLSDVFSKLMKYMFMLGLPMSVGACLLSTQVITLIYGTQFVDAGASLFILIWAGTFSFLSTTCNILLGSINKQFLATKITCIGAIINVGINLVLIPYYSYIGASITSVITEIVILIFMLRAVNSTDIEINIRQSLKPGILIAISNIIMAIFIVYIINLNILLIIPLAAIVYLISLLLTRAINKEDREIILDLIHNVRNK